MNFMYLTKTSFIYEVQILGWLNTPISEPSRGISGNFSPLILVIFDYCRTRTSSVSRAKRTDHSKLSLRSRVEVVRVNLDSIVGRGSSRQSIARLIRLRSKLTRRPAPGSLLFRIPRREDLSRRR